MYNFFFLVLQNELRCSILRFVQFGQILQVYNTQNKYIIFKTTVFYFLEEIKK